METPAIHICLHTKLISLHDTEQMSWVPYYKDDRNDLVDTASRNLSFTAFGTTVDVLPSGVKFGIPSPGKAHSVMLYTATQESTEIPFITQRTFEIKNGIGIQWISQFDRIQSGKVRSKTWCIRDKTLQEITQAGRKNDFNVALI